MAVDRSQFKTQGAAGGAPVTYFTLVKGEIQEIEIPRDQFHAPYPGFYNLRLKALTAPFEASGDWGPYKSVRAVFVVRKPGDGNDKRMFSQPLTVAKLKDGIWKSSVSASSAMGQMIGAIRGKPVEATDELDFLDYLNGDFSALVDNTTKTSDQYGVETYGNIVKDSWKPVQVEAPAPAPKASTAGNPLLSNDDE